MSVVAQNTNVTYVSSGSVGPYGFNFPISDPSALTVFVNATLIPSSGYTIVPVNNNYDNGGSITLNTPAPSGQTVLLQRNTPLTQESEFVDNMPQPMAQFEASLDKLTEICQELAANQSGSGSSAKTYVVSGTGIIVTGTGTLTDPYVISTAAAFSITSFTGGQAGELGQQFINPNFAATYNGTPSGASITNTDSINSPFALSNPYTSATVVGTFVHTAIATTTFTLTATNGVVSPTATQAITWQPRIFAGLGATGATSSVTASGNNAVLSTTDVISSAGLGAETVGQTFGPFTAAGQAIYLLLSGGTHTFTDDISGFPMAFNAPIAVTFVNQFGISLSMFLYGTTNPLTGSFDPKVAS